MSRKIVGRTVTTPMNPQRIVDKVLSEIETVEGKSAYKIALENGFVGTEAEWLESLNGRDGKDGKDGKDGVDGYTPQKNIDYFDGINGKDGADGYTPVKGVDYFTEEDTQVIVDEVVDKLNDGLTIEVDNTLSSESENPVQNKVITAALEDKVSKEAGKGLSEENFTKAEKDKLAQLDPESMKFPTLPEDGSVLVVQANLAQNDPSQPDYVKNREFYDSRRISYYSQEETPNPISFDFPALNFTFFKVSDLVLTRDEIFTKTIVNINGWEYLPQETGIMLETDDLVFVNLDGSYNICFFYKSGQINFTYSGYPFSLDVPKAGVYYIRDIGAGIPEGRTIEISVGEFKKIDRKFIPIDVDHEVSNDGENAVSGKAVYKHTRWLFEKTGQYDSKFWDVDSKINNLESSKNILNNQVQELEIKVEGATTPDLDINDERRPGYVKGRKFYDYKPYKDYTVPEGQEPTETVLFSASDELRNYKGTVKTYLVNSLEEILPQNLIGAKVYATNRGIVKYLTEDDLVVHYDGSFCFKGCLVYLPEDKETWFDGLYMSMSCNASFKVSRKGLYLLEVYTENYDKEGNLVYTLTEKWNKLENKVMQKTLDSKYLTLESDISADSVNPPTTQAVKKEIDEIHNKIARVYRYRGTVEYYTELPTEGNDIGDAYNVINAHPVKNIKDGDNVAWDGEKWDVLAGTVDLSAYAKNETVAEVSQAVSDVSTSVEQIRNSKIDSSLLGEAEGVATLDESGYISDEQIPPSMKEDVMVEGYYNEVNHLFYEDETFTQPIEGKAKKFYLDKTKTVLYVFSGSAFLPLAGGFREEDYLTDEEYEKMMGGMGL